MPFTTEDTNLYRRDVRAKGTALSTSEREVLLKKYLPPTSLPQSKTRRISPTLSKHDTNMTKQVKNESYIRRIRQSFKSFLHLLISLIIQFIFSIYIRFRQITNAVVQKFLSVRHYHHRTPAYIKKDTALMSRLPEHLSVLLKYDPDDDDDGAALETLIDEVADLSAWSAAAGIPLLSVYERTGVLKTYIATVQELVHQKLVLYFGPAPLTPTLRVYAPNISSLSTGPSLDEIEDGSSLQDGQRLSNGDSARSTNGDSSRHESNGTRVLRPHLDVLLLSASDGRDTIVDLTRTLTEMSQAKKIRPKDITSSIINTEIAATTAIPEASLSSKNGTDTERKRPPHSEPDLLIIFAPYVKLDGYPPWQVRLTEIFCVGDSGGDVSRSGTPGRTRVEYQGFLRALWKFAGAQFRYGR